MLRAMMNKRRALSLVMRLIDLEMQRLTLDDM